MNSAPLNMGAENRKRYMSALSFVQVQIPRRSSFCAKGGEKLFPGADYYSILEQQETGEFIRQDYCSTCWHTEDRATKTYWKSKVPLKKEAAQPQDRLAKAVFLLKEAVQQPETLEEAFVLALYLARARQLVLRQECEREGKMYYLYELPKTEEWITVQKLSLSTLDIQAIQQSLAQKLK